MCAPKNWKKPHDLLGHENGDIPIPVLGQYYFGIRYAAAFFERFVVKTDRYQSAFLSQSPPYQKRYEMWKPLWKIIK